MTPLCPAPDDPMDPEEVLRRSEAFDPTPQECTKCHALPSWKGNPIHERIMRLALQMIVAQAHGGQRLHVDGTGMTAYPLIIRTAEQALRECGK